MRSCLFRAVCRDDHSVGVWGLMIHSGHNSFSKDQPVPGIIRDTEAIIDIHPQLPPALIFSTRDDRTAPTQKAEQIAKAFREAHVPVQLEIYERGGHMAFNFPSPKAADWPQRFRQWIQQFNFQSNR